MTILNYLFLKHILYFICLSETYLDATTPTNDDKSKVTTYTLFYCDHPSNTKHGGVCLCCRNSFLLRAIKSDYLHKYMSFEVQIIDKTCNFIALYRSPSQFQDDFEAFC